MASSPAPSGQLATPFRANRPDVIDETFDGEVTLINLASGLFYGLDAPASAIWLQVRDGRTPRAIVEALADALSVTADELQPTVTAFLDQLSEEHLLVTCETEAPPVAAGAVGGWAAPQLQRFSDMQELLLLDPVHEIELDSSGWPIPRAQTADAGG